MRFLAFLLVTLAAQAQAVRTPAAMAVLQRQATEAREQNRTQDALQLYRECVRMQPNWSEGWWYLGTLLHLEVQQFAVPSFKQAVGSPGIHVRKQLDPFRAVVQKHWQRDSLVRRQICMGPGEFNCAGTRPRRRTASLARPVCEPSAGFGLPSHAPHRAPPGV